jgi:hypothetical protein
MRDGERRLAHLHAVSHHHQRLQAHGVLHVVGKQRFERTGDATDEDGSASRSLGFMSSGLEAAVGVKGMTAG